MALIKCPECGKEISDKALSCPNCAFPMTEILKSVDKPTVENDVDVAVGEENNGEENAVAMTYNDTSSTVDESVLGDSSFSGGEEIIKTKSKKPLIIVASILAALALVFGIVYFVHTAKEKERQEAYELAVKKYTRGDYEEASDEFSKLGKYEDSQKYVAVCDAQELCNSGKYENAFDEIKDIEGFKEADELKRNIYYETRFFEGLADMRQYYKNPESLSVNDIEVIYGKYSKEEKPMSKPAFIMKASGQNGFGGYTASYAITSESDDGSYQYLGSCDTLDEDEVDDDEYLAAVLINAYKDEGVKIENAINYERISAIVQEGNYTNIKRVQGLTFDMIENK